MKISKLTTTLPVLLMLIPSAAFAQDAATPPQGGIDLLQPLIDAAKGGKWSIFASLLIMLLVWGATKTPLLSRWIKGPAKIWTAAVAGILAAFAGTVFTGASAGHVDWLAAAVNGLSVGLAAGGLWSLVGRVIAKKPIDANGDGVLDPESTFADDPEPEDPSAPTDPTA